MGKGFTLSHQKVVLDVGIEGIASVGAVTTTASTAEHDH